MKQQDACFVSDIIIGNRNLIVAMSVYCKHRKKLLKKMQTIIIDNDFVLGRDEKRREG